MTAHARPDSIGHKVEVKFLSLKSYFMLFYLSVWWTTFWVWLPSNSSRPVTVLLSALMSCPALMLRRKGDNLKRKRNKTWISQCGHDVVERYPTTCSAPEVRRSIRPAAVADTAVRYLQNSSLHWHLVNEECCRGRSNRVDTEDFCPLKPPGICCLCLTSRDFSVEYIKKFTKNKQRCSLNMEDVSATLTAWLWRWIFMVSWGRIPLTFVWVREISQQPLGGLPFQWRWRPLLDKVTFIWGSTDVSSCMVIECKLKSVY